MRYHDRALPPTARLLAALMLMTLATSLGCDEEPSAQPSPTIQITEPAQGALLNVTRVRVRGMATDAREISVNGRSTSVVAGRWEVALDVNEGPVTVTATARDAQAQVNFRVDASPPQLALTSPARGAVLDAASQGPRIMVQGRASDSGVGLSALSVNAQLITTDDQGAFSIEQPLVHGLNLFEVRAIDEAGNESAHTVGVLYGPMAEPTSPISPGFNLYARRPAIDAATAVLREVMTPELVKSFIDQQLATSESVTIDQIDFDPVELTVLPKTDPVDATKEGFLDMTLVIKNLKLVGQFKLGGQAIGLEVNVSEATARTRMFLRADGQGGLSIEFAQPSLDLPRSSLSWKVNVGGGELSNEDVRLLGQIVEDVARLAFAEILNERIIDQLYDPAILNRRVELLGRTLEFTLRIDEVIINGNGVFVRTSVLMPAERFEQVPQVVGALDRPRGRTSAPKTQTGALVTTDRTALDRLMHGIWRSGLLHQQLKGADFAGIELPFALNAGALALLLDGRVTNYADSSSPVGVSLRPMLPPLLELAPDDQEGSSLKVRLGELHLDILLDVDQPEPKRLLTLATFLELGVSLSIEGTTLGLSFDTSLKADLIDEPLFDLQDALAEEVFVQLAALIPQVLSQGFVINGEADLTWVKLTNPSVEVHGVEADQVTLGLDVEPNPQGL